MTNITAVPYFYDKQFRRYIQQFIRLFAGFQYVKGYTDQGDPIYHTTPVRYGDISRMAAHIQRENSENILSTVPFISCYVTGLEISPDRRTYPNFEDKIPVIEKAYDENTQSYKNEEGNTYTITRHQPVPYKLTMQADIWSSNQEQKMQLLEQILVLFNPSLNIHTTNNALDWSSLSTVELIGTQWSSRGIPQGVDDIIEISTLTFEMPILINPPAKVQKNSMIHTVITNIDEITTGTADQIRAGQSYAPLYTTYSVVTLKNYKMQFNVDNSGLATAKILNRANGTTDEDGSPLNWNNVFDAFGEFRPDISQIRLKQTDDPSNTTTDIVGTLSKNSNPALLTVTLDTNTIPADSQTSVDAVIDPQSSYPGDGTLTAAAIGDRYLVLDEVPSGGSWGTIYAKNNDIIQYDGTTWSVSFDASTIGTTEYTTNTTTMDKLKWNGSQWVNAYEGTYNSGFWRIYL
jgi:hypothetical protein